MFTSTSLVATFSAEARSQALPEGPHHTFRILCSGVLIFLAAMYFGLQFTLVAKGGARGHTLDVHDPIVSQSVRTSQEWEKYWASQIALFGR